MPIFIGLLKVDRVVEFIRFDAYIIRYYWIKINGLLEYFWSAII